MGGLLKTLPMCSVATGQLAKCRESKEAGVAAGRMIY